MIPERTCVGCRTKRPKTQLLRISRLPGTHAVELDEKASKPGRGAYLCSNPHCWQVGLGKRYLDRTLRVPLTATNRRSLEEQLLQYSMKVSDER